MLTGPGYVQNVVGHIDMLYVKLEVNGVPVKAFVDSGAQMTIMTQEFAEKCFLTRLIDKRFHGTAQGVGSAPIIGRIHQVGPSFQNQEFKTCMSFKSCGSFSNTPLA